MWVELHYIDEETAFSILVDLSDKTLLTFVKKTLVCLVTALKSLVDFLCLCQRKCLKVIGLTWNSQRHKF
ncbi:unnamed protein product [Brassica oleracea]